MCKIRSAMAVRPQFLIANAYQIEEQLDFKHESMVTLYRATSLARNRLPVVIKKHEFRMLSKPETQERITSCLNAVLSQAKVQHSNSCDILEVQFKVEGSNCDVYHILESLETSVGKDIQKGKRYNEQEMLQFLLQTSSALAYAHNKVRVTQQIAHRDIKPDNVFRTGNTFKVGDFDCVFLKRESSVTNNPAGDPRYMSPQLRKAYFNHSPYNAFKADVFALGASFIHLATLTSPESLLTEENLDERVSRTVESLPYCELLKILLKKMLAYNEKKRPTMTEVYETLSEIKSPQQLQRASLQEKLFPTYIIEEIEVPQQPVCQPLPELKNICPACHIPLQGLRCSCGFVNQTTMSNPELRYLNEVKARIRDARETENVTCRQCGWNATSKGETDCYNCGKPLNCDEFLKSSKFWSCPSCSNQNNIRVSCVRCNALKPAAPKSNTRTSDFLQAAIPGSFLPWACLCCSEINLQGNTCKKCHEPKGKRKQNEWQCKCKSLHPMDKNCCPQCHQSNPRFKQSVIGRYSPPPAKENEFGLLRHDLHVRLNNIESFRRYSPEHARRKGFEQQRHDSDARLDEPVKDEQWTCPSCKIVNHGLLEYCLCCGSIKHLRRN